jgi:hypothetical protein
MIYYTPIWDVLAPEEEQEGALNHLRMRSRSPAFLIGKAVPVGLPQASGSVFHGKKFVLW